MAQWQSVNVFPGPLQPVLTAVIDALDGAAAIEEALAAADKASAILTAASAASADLAQATSLLASVVDAFLADILATDVYILPLGPLSAEDLLDGFSMDEALIQMAQAFGDVRDPDRPDFSADAASAGLAILGGAQTITDLKALIDFWRTLYGDTTGGAWRTLRQRLKVFGETTPVPPAVRGLGGTPPDWTRVAAGRLLPLWGDAIPALRAATASYASGTTLLIDAMTDVLGTHAAVVSAAAANVRALLAALEAAKGKIGANLHLLLVPPSSTGGTGHFVISVEDATNRPSDQYVAGVVLFVGSASLGGLKRAWNALVTLIGRTADMVAL